MNGTIFDKEDYSFEEPPLHERCKCRVEGLVAIRSGTATIEGGLGADHWVAAFAELPKYYITKKEAKDKGWKAYKGNLKSVLPGKSIGGDIYFNRDRKLPVASGRLWREADINYTGGFRNGHRILYSNDGLIFVTYDHYQTFYEII